MLIQVLVADKTFDKSASHGSDFFEEKEISKNIFWRDSRPDFNL